MARTVVTAGVDVSQGWLHTALWPSRDTIRLTSTAAGYEALAAWLTEHGVCRVGLEATGGYEIPIIDALEACGFEVVRFNAQRVRRFAEATGSPKPRDDWPKTIAPMRSPSHKQPRCWWMLRRGRADAISTPWSST